MTHLILQEWKLEIINLKKTKITAFHQRKILKSNFYSRHDVIEQVHKFEYLGVIFFHKMAISPLPEKIRIVTWKAMRVARVSSIERVSRFARLGRIARVSRVIKVSRVARISRFVRVLRVASVSIVARVSRVLWVARVSIVARGSRVA